MRRRRLEVPLVLLTALLAVPGASARTVSGRRADRVAIHALGGLARQKRIVVFRSPRPLRAGTRVRAADGGPGIRLHRAAWFFWADLAPTADLDHPSAIILVGARSGKIVRAGRLLRWPLVNGRLPAFLRTLKAYAAHRDHVLVRGLGATGATARAAPRVPPARAASLAAAPGQCAIVVGGSQELAKDWNWGEHSADARTFTGFARDALKIPTIYTAGNLSQLRDRISLAQGKGCTGITIFMTGEGSAPPKWIDPATGLGPYPGNPRANIQLGPGDERIYGPNLDKALRAARANTPPGSAPPTFTLLIQGCFSGRMADALKATPGVGAVITSSGPRTESTRETNLAKFLNGFRPSPFVTEVLGGILDKIGESGGDVGQAAQAAFLDLPASEDAPEMEVSGRIITKGPLAVARCTDFHQAGCIDFHGGIYSGGDGRRVASGSLEIQVGSVGYCLQRDCEFTDCYVCPHLDTTFPKGATVTAVATPSQGSVFARWGPGECSGQGATCTFTATKPSCIDAQFLLQNPTAPPQSLPDAPCAEDP